MDQTSRTPERSEGRRALGGILIMGVLLVLSILIVSLDEILASRIPTVDVHAELPETEGLAAGAPVWIAGAEVGEVVSVSLLPPNHFGESRVVALARIPREHLPMLRSDSRARVTTPGFVGDPLLELSPGTPAAPGIAASDTIQAEFGPDRVSQAIGTARGLLVETDTLLGQLRQVAALYRERRPVLEEVSRSLALASAELDRTSASLERSPFAAAFREGELQARFGRVRASLAVLQAGLGRYTAGPLGERLGALGVRADSLQAELATLDSLAGDPRGFVGRARSDSALSVEAARASAQLDSLVEDVKSNPFMFF